MEDSDMTHVLIVDDEIAVRYSIANKLRKDKGRRYSIKEAGYAEEAYRILKKSPPNIILLDMHLPGMGGMKFLEILRGQFPHIKVIILSGYTDFEYVKQSLRCGAVDYLLKPIIKEELFKAIAKAVDMIQLDRKKTDREIRRNQLLNQSVPLLKTNLLNTLLNSENRNAAKLFENLRLLDIKLNYNYYALVIINLNNFDKIKSFYMSDASLVFFTLENVLFESIVSLNHFIGFKSLFRENEFLCILGFNEKEGIREQLEYVFTNTIKNIRVYTEIHITVSISNLFENILEINQFYRKISSFWQNKHSYRDLSVLFLEDYEVVQDQISMELWVQEFIGDFYDFIQNNDMKGIIGKMNQMFQAVENEKVSKESLPSVYEKLAATIYKAVEKQAQNLQLFNDKLFFDIPNFNEMLTVYCNQDDIKYGILKVLIGFKDSTSKANRNHGKYIVNQAKEYIDKYYPENITLDVLSRKFYINRTYLSELFKQETGLTFKRYLNHKRIEKAKQLLRNERMKADQVCLLVGFQDPFYFSDVFKKYTGCSIKEFKERLG